jgi:hypothetical protein
MTWETVVQRARSKDIKVVPVNRPWWKNCYAKILLAEQLVSSRTQNVHRGDRIWSLYYHIRNKTSARFQRSRLEGRELGLFFDNPTDLIDMLDLVDPLIADASGAYAILEIHCPLNDHHVEFIDNEFPTRVRSTLFGEQYRYRIVAEVPYGIRGNPTAFANLCSMFTDWQAWQANGDGKISKGASGRFRQFSFRRNEMEFARSGVMSFYTNSTELSFISKLSHPDFYRMTEKAITVAEVNHAARESRSSILDLGSQ